MKIINRVEEVCYCPRHQGDTLRQADIELPSGRLVRVMMDKYGYYYKFGTQEMNGCWGYLPHPVSKEEFKRVVTEAIRG